MSLGGATLFAGRDIEDQLTLAMLEVGITLVASAGNDGHAAMTGGSPGTGFGSLTVAAANTAVHERVLRDNQFGFGAGEILPADHAHADRVFQLAWADRGRPHRSRHHRQRLRQLTCALPRLTATGRVSDCREPGAVPGTCAARCCSRLARRSPRP